MSDGQERVLGSAFPIGKTPCIVWGPFLSLGWSRSVALGGVPVVTCFPWALGPLT